MESLSRVHFRGEASVPQRCSEESKELATELNSCGKAQMLLWLRCLTITMLFKH